MSETAAQRLSRLLALVPWLMAHQGVTMAETAAHFGVSEAELERDLLLLIVCGVPGYGPDQLVDIQFWDGDGRIHVLDPLTLRRPLRLSQQEALTLLVALRMLAQVPGVNDRDAILSAAAKLEVAASAADADRVVTVEVLVDPRVRAAIDAALSDGRALAIRYASGTSDEVTERVIEPRRLLTVDVLSYLEAYCHSAGALRTFRLDRVLSAAPEEVPERPTAPAAPADRALPPASARLRLRPEARWVVDVHRAEVIGPGPEEGTTEVRLPMLSVEWAARLVLSLRGTAVALEPPALVEAVAGAAASALAAYAD